MTHAFLQAELTSLISDSKRKHNDVRTAAEQTLADLKSILATSDTHLARELQQKPQFVDPFVLACTTKNAKLAATATVCLQRLAASKAIARARLADVLDACRNAVASGYAPQLKVLQTLPSLLQFYAGDLHGPLLARTLETCASLQSSKTAIVSNTAAATFEQLISTVFEHAVEFHRQSHDAPPPDEESAANPAAEDAMRIFKDLCLLLDQQDPQFLAVRSLEPGFVLESIYIILSSHAACLRYHIDDIQDCWTHLGQGLSRSLARKDVFGLVVRALSVIQAVVQGFPAHFQRPIAPVIPQLVNGLERDGNPPWRRALFLEFARILCSNFAVMREVFESFDSGDSSNKLIGPIMSAFVRIASEDPSLIGLSRQSTMPVQRTNEFKTEDVASIEAQGLGGAITTVSSGDAATTGISRDWSTLNTPLMDQPEKQVPPAVPTTYVYTLILESIAAFCDGLSKFIMPLSVATRPANADGSNPTADDRNTDDAQGLEGPAKPTRSATSTQKYQRLINPLTLNGHAQMTQLQTCANLIEACWPACLATCSTFLNSALDAEYYHALMRSVQKLAQVSGVLGLTTPRDALLTTLAKASIPTNATSIIVHHQNARASRTKSPEHEAVDEGIKSPTEAPLAAGHQLQSSPLNVRHLLSLRALLNLGIALGPMLEQDTWFILIETLQTIEALIALPAVSATTSQSPMTRGSGMDGQATLSSEIVAVQAATKRMLESTRTFSSESFAVIVKALYRLLGQANLDGALPPVEERRPVGAPNSPTSGARNHSAQKRSVSGLWTKSKTLDLEVGFVLGKISDLSRINIHRFASTAEISFSWQLIGTRLLQLSQDSVQTESHRLHSASILDLISMETVKILDGSQDGSEEDEIRSRCLQYLLLQLDGFDDKREGDVEFEIHRRLLEALESILSHTGESLDEGWTIALRILFISYEQQARTSPAPETNEDREAVDEHPARILRTAFRSIQLISSDFLEVLAPTHLMSLSRLLRLFGSQPYDLNVALTSTTLLWGIASQVLLRVDTIDLANLPVGHDTKHSGAEPSTSQSELWGIVLQQLTALAQDSRPDVRNAAVRILLKLLEASSAHLTPRAWAVGLADGPLKVIHKCWENYHVNDGEKILWLTSALQLMDGTLQLIAQHLKTIAENERFEDIWIGVMDVLEDLVQVMSFAASFSVFSNLSRLVVAFRELDKAKLSLLRMALKIWISHHPADIGGMADDGSNQEAYTAHMECFVEVYRLSPDTVLQYQHSSQDLPTLLMDALERTVLSATHPLYTSDVKSLAPEQAQVVKCIEILRTILSDDAARYSDYVLRLVGRSLRIEHGKVLGTKKNMATSKASLRPTFIAFVSTCLEKIRAAFLGDFPDEAFIRVALRQGLETLAALIDTKYTIIPTNNQAPLWRNASVTVVAILEALQKRVQNGAPLALLGHEEVGAVVTSATSSVLGPGGLSTMPSPPPESALLEDEAFDVDHFWMMHSVIVQVFGLVEMGTDMRKAYAIALFKASLLATPWFFDIPDDLAESPLTHLTRVRPGTVHLPIFRPRKAVCYAAFDALVGLVQRPDISVTSSTPLTAHRWAVGASPYLILRVIHPLKSFLADQRLRGLTPPPMTQQVELQTVLSKYVAMRGDDGAVRDVISGFTELRRDHSDSAKSPAAPFSDDGKEHLRCLYPFILRVHRFWRQLPKLASGGAWQGNEPGQAIELALTQWIETIGEEWGLEEAG